MALRKSQRRAHKGRRSGLLSGQRACPRRDVYKRQASIVAKVTRDRYMIELDRQYPMYGFARNKGYGTAEHIAALKKYGPCPEHRRTFIKNFI